MGGYKQPDDPSRSGTHVKRADGGWRDSREADWSDPERIARLVRCIEADMTSRRIAEEFGDVSRSGVIGAIKRLYASGKITVKLKEQNQSKGRRRTLPDPQKRKKGSNEPKVHKLVVRDHNGHLEQVEVVAWETHEELETYNNKRKQHAKPIDEVNGCRWPINDTHPFLFCNGKKPDGKNYCEEHEYWAHKSNKIANPLKRKKSGRLVSGFGTVNLKRD